MKEAALKESCQKLVNQIVDDIHTSPQNADKSKFLTFDVKDASIIWNLMRGGYDFSLNQYNFIIENLQMLKTIASNDMQERYGKKKPEGYTWGQEYKHHFRGDTQMIKSFPDERPRNQNNINKITGDEMHPAIALKKIKKPAPIPGISLQTAAKSPAVLKWYTHKTNKDECCYCGIMLTEHNRSRDHVRPQWKGGKRVGNLVWCCTQCNGLKGGHSLETWLELLKDKLPSLTNNLVLTKYHERVIEAVTYMIKIQSDDDLITDPENIKAASINKHLYTAINKKKRKQAQF